MRTRSFSIALVTAPSIKVARALARECLAARLVACVNILPGIESHYWWQGKMEKGKEVLLIFKTQRKLLASLEKLVIEKHPYDTPEFVVIDITSGNAKYLAWLGKETGA